MFLKALIASSLFLSLGLFNFSNKIYADDASSAKGGNNALVVSNKVKKQKKNKTQISC